MAEVANSATKLCFLQGFTKCVLKAVILVLYLRWVSHKEITYKMWHQGGKIKNKHLKNSFKKMMYYGAYIRVPVDNSHPMLTKIIHFCALELLVLHNFIRGNNLRHVNLQYKLTSK